MVAHSTSKRLIDRLEIVNDANNDAAMLIIFITYTIGIGFWVMWGCVLLEIWEFMIQLGPMRIPFTKKI